MTLDLSAINIAVLIAMGLAALTQSITGFGFALMAMPILASVISLDLATSLLALAGLFNGTFMWLIYRHAFEFKAVLRLLTGSWLGIPIGLYGLHYAPESLALMLLGIIVAGYALYTLIGAALPKLDSPTWGYGFGMGAGILSGSYNIPGPAVVFYGQCRRWMPAQFKSNLTGFFWFNSVAVVVGHGLQHRLNHEVFTQFAIAIPVILIGLGVGTIVSRYLNPNIFRRIVLFFLVLTGIRLVWMGLQGFL